MQHLATALFAIAVLHTFLVKYFIKISHKYPNDSIPSRLFHFLGEVEVVFGLWAGLFIFLVYIFAGKDPAIQYMESRNFTEPLFVFAIMTIAATKPVIDLARMLINSISKFIPLPKQKSFYVSCMIVGPILGSFITEPAAMTVTALLLRDRYISDSSDRFKYLTLGLLFVNVSIGGVLTPYAAPPVLMVANTWGWDLAYMFEHFGYKSVLAVTINTLIVTMLLWKDFKSHVVESNTRRAPIWLKIIHIFFLFAVVSTAHYPTLFMGFLMFFMGVTAITKDLQEPLKIREGLLVGFFLGGLVVLGGLQSWWLDPIIRGMSETAVFLGATVLTAVTDNAALTYLGSQIHGLTDQFKFMLVAGAVSGGGLTIIANAPNPAGASILSKNFGGAINPVKLLYSAILPTVIAMLCFYFLPHHN